MTNNGTDPLRVLHLVGSPVSDFYYQLSMIYAREVIHPPNTVSCYVLIHPDGLWQLGASLETLSERRSLQILLPQLMEMEIDLVIPHMFCFPGMTSYRSFFEDILKIPVVGSPSRCTAIAANKAQTRSIVADAGVRVAKAQLLHRGDQPTLSPPFIVKPNSEDNSLGLTLVWEPDQIPTALRVGFEFDEVLLAEDYIPGREIRVAVIEDQKDLYTPPLIEYLVSEEHPIRTVHEKLQLNNDGIPEQQNKGSAVRPICPAPVTSQLFEQLSKAAKRAHRALGCRDYSLYDFRVHQETGEPYLLEAGLFWCFSQISMISQMVSAAGRDLEEVVANLWFQAARRNPSMGDPLLDPKEPPALQEIDR